jgi:hypothetical protein
LLDSSDGFFVRDKATKERGSKDKEKDIPMRQSRITVALMVGGSSVAAGLEAFERRGGHVLVGTPGRIMDMLNRCSVMDTRRYAYLNRALDFITALPLLVTQTKTLFTKRTNQHSQFTSHHSALKF